MIYNVKYFITLLLLQFICLSVIAQKSFEGEAVYTVNFQSHNPAISNERMGDMLGRTMDFYTKGGKYKSIFGAKIYQWYSYTGTGKLFLKITGKDSLFTADLTVNHDTIYKTELKKNDTTILGYKCNKLTFHCNTGKQVYYYDPQFAIDPDLYVLHQEGNWHEYLKIAKAVALKQVIERKLYTVTTVVTSIQRKPVEDKFFDLPKDMPIVPEPSK